MKAKIEKDKSGIGLRVIIDNDYPNLGVSWPITEEEVEVIRDACNEWLGHSGEVSEMVKEDYAS